MPTRQPNIIFILMLVAFAHMIVTSYAQEDDGADEPPLTVQSQELMGTAFVSWSPEGSMIAKGFGDEIQIIDAETMTVTLPQFGGHQKCPIN